MSRAAVLVVALSVLATRADAYAMRFTDTFDTWMLRRGQGGTTTNQGWTAPTVSGQPQWQYSDPSPGWRAEHDGFSDGEYFGSGTRLSYGTAMRVIPQGPVNWWIDPASNELKHARVDGVDGMTTPVGGNRNASDLTGPVILRNPSGSTAVAAVACGAGVLVPGNCLFPDSWSSSRFANYAGTAVPAPYPPGALQASSTVLQGTFGGVYFLAEGAGVSSQFEQLAADFAAYEPLQGGYPVGGAYGLVFNVRTDNYGKSGYAVMLRNFASASVSEVGIGCFKFTGAAPLNFARGAFPCGASWAASRNASVVVPANTAPWTTMNANGPRVWTRLHVSKTNLFTGATYTGTRIRAWLNNNPANVLLDVTDSATTLPTYKLDEGMVGVYAIGMNALVVDNFLFADTPTCTDRVYNGDEAGIDCGGSCPTPCPATPQTFLWAPATAPGGGATGYSTAAAGGVLPAPWTGWPNAVAGTTVLSTPTSVGHYGLAHHTYGNNPNGDYWGATITYADNFDYMVSPANTNGNPPGSTGANSQSWMGSFELLQTAWGTFRDVDFTFEFQPGDNDWIGPCWRFLDRDNYYALSGRTESGSGVPQLALQRRKNGRNVVIWNSPASYVTQTGGTTGNPSSNCAVTEATYSLYPRVPYNSCVRMKWRVVMRGARIDIYMPRVDTYANHVADAHSPPLFVSIVDPDPLLAPGYVGSAQISHDHLRWYSWYLVAPTGVTYTPSPTPALAALPVSAAAKAAMVLGIDARSAPTVSPGAAGTVEGIASYDGSGLSLYTSYYMIANPASVPVLGAAPGGAALTFSNAVAPTFLYSHLIKGGDPGVAGMTLAVCFTLTAVPTGNAKHYVASRGLRPAVGGTAAAAAAAGAPAYNQGWALYAASVNGTNRLFFDASSFNPADSFASVSVALNASVAAVVLVTVAPDAATAGNAQLESRRFLVSATLNGVPFDDAANNDYTGIIMANEGVELVVGAREDGAAGTGFAGQLREVTLFGLPLPPAEGAALSAYYAGRHGAGAPSCPPLVGLPRVLNTSAACAAPVNGGVCTMACAPGSMLVAGATAVTCAGGVWSGGRLPTCVAACNVSTATAAAGSDQAGCAYDLWTEAWPAVTTALGQSGAAPSTLAPTPAGANTWAVAAPGTVTAYPTSASSPARLVTAGLYASYEPSLTAAGAVTGVAGAVALPAADMQTALVDFYPRFVDASNYYAVRLTYAQADGFILTGTGLTATPVTPALSFVRVVGGVASTLCTPAVAPPTLPAPALTAHEVAFEATGKLTVTTNGVAWCSLPSEVALPLGDPGYGVLGVAPVTFGRLRVFRSFPQCPTGTLRPTVPAGANVTTGCNPGYAVAGAASRACGPAGGALLGAPLTCVLTPPVFGNASVAVIETAPVGRNVTLLAPVNGVPQGYTVKYEFVSGNTGGAFAVGGCDGVVRVANAGAMDYDGLLGANAFALGVRATIVGTNLTYTGFVFVTVLNGNKPPRLSFTTPATCSTDERAPAGSPVCSLRVIDPDGGVTAAWTVAITAAEVPGVFRLAGGSTGGASVAGGAALGDAALITATAATDFAEKPSYTLTVTVTDAADATSFSVSVLTIVINDMPDAPYVAGPNPVRVLSSLLATAGAPLGQSVSAADPDCCIGPAIVSYALDTVPSAPNCNGPGNACPALIAVNVTTGALVSAGANAYGLASLRVVDGVTVVDYTEVTLRATDNTPGVSSPYGKTPTYITGPLTGSFTVKVYVLPNITTAGVLVLSSAVLPANPGSGAGTFPGGQLLETAGGDAIRYAMDRFDPAATGAVSLTATGPGGRTWTAACAVERDTTTGAPLGVLCGTGAGYGGTAAAPWALALSRALPAPAAIPSAAPMSFYYAPPVITSADKVNSADAVPTTGGTAYVVRGFNFGGPALFSQVAVTYGATGQFALVVASAAGVTHTTITGRLSPGDGAGLPVFVSVAGVATGGGAAASAAAVVSYDAPVVASISRVATGGAPTGLSGAGGDVLAIRGTNLGVGGAGLPVLLFGALPAGYTTAALPLAPALLPALRLATRDASGASTCTVFTAHVEVRCRVYTGVGANLVSTLLVSGQYSPVVGGPPGPGGTAASLISFAPPLATGVSGVGAAFFSTKGGDAFTLTGANFGPAAMQGAGAPFPAPAVYYGPATDPLRFAAVQCAIDTPALPTPASTITCQTAEGSGGGAPLGAGFVVTVTAGGQTGGAWQAPPSFEYAAPLITAVVTDLTALTPNLAAAATAADTRGGQLVQLVGLNFGAFNASGFDARGVGYSVFYEGAVSTNPDDANAPLAPTKFVAPSCFKSAAQLGQTQYRLYHNYMYCSLAPGAGAGLRFSVNVTGKLSAVPSTRYAPPLVTAVSSTPTGAVVRVGGASDLGGDVVYLRGTNFGAGAAARPGPLAAANFTLTSYVQSVVFSAAGGAEGPGAYSAAAFSLVTDHSLIAVTLPPGVGSNLWFGVKVADAVSGRPPPAVPLAQYTFDYKAPAIVAAAPFPLTGATAGGSVIKLFVTGAGMLDATAGQDVAFGYGAAGGTLVVDEFPPLARVAGAGGNLSALLPAERAPANHYVSFVAPAGQGLNVPVRVHVTRDNDAANDTSIYSQCDPTTAGGAAVPNDGANCRFSYPLPAIQTVSISATLSPATAAWLAAVAPTRANSSSTREMTLLGRNFGPSGAGGARIDVLNATSLELYRSPPGPLDIALWTDTAIVALVELTDGYVRLATCDYAPAAGGRPGGCATSTAYGVPGWTGLSNAIRYNDLAPNVQGIVGGAGSSPGGPYATAGGDVLAVSVGNVAAFTTLSVSVGNASAAFCSADGLTRGLSAAAVLATVIAPQVAAATAAGRDPATVAYTIYVVLPPGQGSAVAVSVTRDGQTGSGPFFVKYAPPAIASLTVENAVPAGGVSAAPVDAALPSPASPFRVPTAGAVVALAGANFGTCPVVRFGVLRGAACGADQLAGDALTVLFSSHSALRVAVPPGVGNGGGAWTLVLLAADQAAPAVPVAYGLPAVTGVFAPAGDPRLPGGAWGPGGAGYGFPTLGGVFIVVNGSNFGADTQPLPTLAFQIDPAPAAAIPCAGLSRCPTDPHGSLLCTLPPGSGAGVPMLMSLGGQAYTSVFVAGARDASSGLPIPIFSYDPPVIATVTRLFEARGGGDSAGGYETRITGANFGSPALAGGAPNFLSRMCIFMPAASVQNSALACDGVANNWDEWEVPSFNSWTDGFISFTMVSGIGKRDVRLMSRGQASAPGNPNAAWVFGAGIQPGVYGPVITGVSPATASTAGATLVTITGGGFGFGSTIAANAARKAPGYLPRAIPRAGAGVSGAYALPFALRIDWWGSTVKCISSNVVADTPSNSPAFGVSGCASDVAGSPYGVVSHTFNAIQFYAPPGVGVNHPLTVTIISPDGSSMTSAPAFPFSYSPPTLTSINPSRVVADEPLALGGGLYAVPATPLTLYGNDFGRAADAGDWTPAERVVSVTIDSAPCAGAGRASAGAPPVDVLACSYGASTAGGVPLSAIPTVGFKNVTVLVAGQFSRVPPPSPSLLQVVCDADAYGRPGEVCQACPVGGVCDGYRPELASLAVGGAADKVALYGPVNVSRFVTRNGLVTTECFNCHTRPRAAPGFFNMRGIVNDQGASDSICPPITVATSARAAVDCEYIVACDPPEACAGNNVCGAGYANLKYPFRCSQCAEGYFRNNATCRVCPTNPWLNIALVLLFLIGAVALGYLLNQKNVNIAFVTIGVDYIQVVAIFAATRVAWPGEIKDLFRVLSAFNLNIELIAPECTFKGISYAQKWAMIMALPLGVAALLGFVFALNVFVPIVLKGQNPRAVVSANLNTPVGMAMVLVYFLYLYMTRTVFDVMTCRSMDPPEYDSTGAEILYMAGVVERCGLAGGTQVTLLPAAVAGLVVYVLGYPAFIGYKLYSHRKTVMLDQLLRAKRTGDDKLSNPLAFDFRRRYARVYYQFRPDMCLWVLAILARKFCIAIASLIFNTNQNFQMAAMLFVLFVAYAAQMRFLPYMPPANFQDEIRRHEAAARAGSPAHRELAAVVAAVAAQGKKKAHRLTFNELTSASASQIAGAVGAFLFDYNTVEALFIASGLLVALAGVMFGASTATASSSFYADSRRGVTAAVLLLIAVTVVFWVAVLAVELTGEIREGVNAARKAMARRRAAGKGGAGAGDAEGGASPRKGKGKRASGDDDEGASTPAAAGFSAVVGAPVDSTSNPMFVNAATGRAIGGGGGGAGGGGALVLSRADMEALERAPTDVSTWIVVREAYIAAAERAAAAAADVQRLKAEVARKELEAADARDAGGRRGSAGGAGGDGGGAARAAKKRAFGPLTAAGGEVGAGAGGAGGGGASPLGARGGLNPLLGGSGRGAAGVSMRALGKK